MGKLTGILGIYARTSIETEGTSIEQQKNLGISFASNNGLEYQLYEDNGKSGFKIDDDENPFKHRKGLTKLISDIENKIVNKSGSMSIADYQEISIVLMFYFAYSRNIT